MSNIVYKNKDFVVINKPIGVSSQADNSGGDDALTMCKMQLSELGETGEIHVVNRLDKVVGGLVLLARSSAAAASLSSLLGEKMIKEYYAVVEGEAGCGEMKDFIYKDSALSRAVVVTGSSHGAKEAQLEFSTFEGVSHKGRTLSLVKVRLKTGRFHQIRAQFSSRGMPLVGDKKYGSRDFGCRTPALFAARLAFEYKSELYDVRIAPDLDAYPWSLFSKENFEK